MPRCAADDLETRAAEARLLVARRMMAEALTLLDCTPVLTDCDAHLDQAIHQLDSAIAQVRAGEAVFHEGRTFPIEPDEHDDLRSSGG